MQKGIRISFDIDTKFFFTFAIFVLLAGPTLDLLLVGAKAFGRYLTELSPRSLIIGESSNRERVNA